MIVDEVDGEGEGEELTELVIRLLATKMKGGFISLVIIN